MIKALFEFLKKGAQSCVECGGRLEPTAVKMGFGNEIIATYACMNPKCRAHASGLRSFRRMLPSAVERIRGEGILSEEEIFEIERQRHAAVAAEIRCPICGRKMTYSETGFEGDMKLRHRFVCKNRKCRAEGTAVFIELLDSDIERIEAAAAERAKCRICGEVTGAKVKCGLHGGYICEKHCEGCEWHDERTSQTHCLWQRRKGIPDAAREGLEAYEKVVREHEEI